MVKKKLVEELISDGTRLLHELDRENFAVDSMFWIHRPEDDYWRLILGSPIVATRGAADAYRTLGRILENIDLAGVTLEDISLLDPESPQFQALRSQAAASGRLAAGLAWDEFEDAVFYRWTSACICGDLNCQVSDSDLTRFWEAERKRSNLPALLVHINGRRITLRFHPQHGALGGIDQIRNAFAFALHRPDARPDCQIKWLN